jgi:hypothetical protein
VSDPKPVPEALFSIPEDADETTKLHMRAQMVIQAAFYAFGDPDARPGTATLGTKELLEVLSMSMALLLAANEGVRTPSDVRKATEHYEKIIRAHVLDWRDDATASQMLAMLGISTSALH